MFHTRQLHVVWLNLVINNYKKKITLNKRKGDAAKHQSNHKKSGNKVWDLALDF